MHFPLNLFLQFLACRDSWLGQSFGTRTHCPLSGHRRRSMLLLSLGLLAICICLRVCAARALERQVTERARLKIGSKPWNMRDLLDVAGALILVFVVGRGIGVHRQIRPRGRGGALPWLLGTDMMLRVAVLFGVRGAVSPTRHRLAAGDRSSA